MFFTYLTQLAAPARQMANVIVTAQQARAGAERVLELLDSLSDVTERRGRRRPAAVRADGSPSTTSRSATCALSRCCLISISASNPARPWRSSAPLARASRRSGSCSRAFTTRKTGAVRIDGIDVRDVTFDSLRRQIGVVFEEAFLFSDSVRSNIAYGRPDATDEEIIAAARAAEAHEFITALPNGYDTVVGERGLLLSGGQRQRITLARALLTDPRILLLDDATSSIDARIEQEIHQTLRRLMVGRTTLVVAHRRSTLRLAEQHRRPRRRSGRRPGNARGAALSAVRSTAHCSPGPVKTPREPASISRCRRRPPRMPGAR